MEFLFNLDHQPPKCALLLGDFMLDRYTVGSVTRVSPEAPVCVLNVKEETSRPGGAGNAVLNLLSLGMRVKTCGQVGNDASGATLLNTLQKKGADTCGVFKVANQPTIVKNRFIADHQQLVRVDYEETKPVPKVQEERIKKALPALLEGVDVIALSDYGKGFLTPSLLSFLIELAQSNSIPLLVDPKGVDYSKYQGATLIKPNLHEAYLASGLEACASLDEVAKTLLKKTRATHLLITRSSEGISLFTNNDRQDFPAKVRDVKDVTGAGDTVLAIMTLCLAHNCPLEEAVRLANLAAGIAVERVGCQQVSLHELQERLQVPIAALTS